MKLKRSYEMKSEEENRIRYPEFKQLVDSFYQEELKEIELSSDERNTKREKVKLQPTFIYENHSKEIRLEFNIGIEQMYRLKNFPEFYDRIQKKETYQYGKYLTFVHKEENFSEDSQNLLKFLLRYAEVIKYVNMGSYNRFRYYVKGINDDYILINPSGMDEIFDILAGQIIEVEKNYIKSNIELVAQEPNIEFSVVKISKEEYVLFPNIDVEKCFILDGNKYSYLLWNKKLYRCGKEYARHQLKVISILKENYQTKMKFSKKELKEFFSFIVPRMKQNILFEEDTELEKYIPKPLKVKIYLDSDKEKNVIASIRFCYEKVEFNPFKDNIDIPRDVTNEAKALNHFYQIGFMLDRRRYRLILTQEEKIYDFLTRDLEEYKNQYEILISDDFKEKQIKSPKISSIGVKVENNLLKLDLEQLNIDKAELKEVLKQYHLKKKYYRLKDGTFLDFYHNSDIAFLDSLVTNMEVSYKELEEDVICLPIHRSYYLNQLLDCLKHASITKEDSYKDIVSKKAEEQIKIPGSMKRILRDYQKTGFRWLKTLEQYKFGGILADDMGLGKTIQILSVLKDYVGSNSEGERIPSFVVSPSSLCLNWYNEVQKFAPNLKTLVIRGSMEERKEQINEIPKYDLVITSYDLLKRDLDLYQEKNYDFQYIIADEAQYIKNSNTKNSKAIKMLKGKTKFALTGTPIENSLAELWAIFDFIMPGYLFSYRKFKEQFELPIIKEKDEQAMQKLKQMIEPFVLRRTKKEVLTELPDKTVTVLNNEMEGEQLSLYVSYLSQAKQELKEELELNGIEKSHIKILALLTRLRQICCYPGLFLSGYHGESSKLNQCIEITKEAIKSGHKILLFSSYTSMFEKIEEVFKKEKISYFKLTGQTKVGERIELVEEFNKDDKIKVFLISLKAGGTGLNLTSADMVIHYDPWWNMSAENQATDRTYRIGQTHNVQVYKLITKNSIEEKIYELQQKKENLADKMLSTQTTFMNQLTKEDIMNLFEI